MLRSSEISYFNADYVSKNKSLIDGYLEVYEGLCDVKKVNLFFPPYFCFLFNNGGWEIYVVCLDFLGWSF